MKIDRTWPEFEALTARLLQNLKVGAGEHTRARFHVDLGNEPNQPDPQFLSYRSSMLSIDAGAKGKPFIKGQADREVRALLTARALAGAPLYLLQYDFSKDGTEWHMTVKAQSCDEYRAMCLDRRALEDAVEPLLRRAAEGAFADWKEVALAYEARKKRCRVIAQSRTSELRDAAVAPEVLTSLEAFKAFYGARGFELDVFELQLLGGAARAVRSITDYYV